MQYASENPIPVTLELGGKAPNIFFADVMEADDDFFDKALEGFAMFALNQGEVCTCPVTRAGAGVDRSSLHGTAPWGRCTKAIVEGNPLEAVHDDRRAGVERPAGEDPELHRHREEGRREGTTGGARRVHDGELAEGYYVQPTILEGQNKIGVQEEIFGPVVAVTRFKDQ